MKIDNLFAEAAAEFEKLCDNALISDQNYEPREDPNRIEYWIKRQRENLSEDTIDRLVIGGCYAVDVGEDVAPWVCELAEKRGVNLLAIGVGLDVYGCKVWRCLTQSMSHFNNIKLEINYEATEFSQEAEHEIRRYESGTNNFNENKQAFLDARELYGII